MAYTVASIYSLLMPGVSAKRQLEKINKAGVDSPLSVVVDRL